MELGERLSFCLMSSIRYPFTFSLKLFDAPCGCLHPRNNDLLFEGLKQKNSIEKEEDEGEMDKHMKLNKDGEYEYMSSDEEK